MPQMGYCDLNNKECLSILKYHMSQAYWEHCWVELEVYQATESTSMLEVFGQTRLTIP